MKTAIAHVPGLLVLSVLAACDVAPSTALPGTIERDRIEVAADANEPIVARAVHEGQSVKRGEVLIAQDSVIARAQLDAADAAVAQQQALLDERLAGARRENRAAARARVDSARVRLQVETREWQRLRDLVAQKLVSDSQLVRQEGLKDTAATALREAEQSLAELTNGTRPEQIAQARQALAQARARQRELATGAGRLTVNAPIDGIVDALPFHVGERPPRGATVAVLLAQGAPFVRSYLPEPRRNEVKVGSRARIRVDGIAQPFDGEVRYISSEAAYTPYYSLTAADRSRLAFRIEVTVLGEAAHALPAGIPAEIEWVPAATP
jgi:HlyD family secretion protein